MKYLCVFLCLFGLFGQLKATTVSVILEKEYIPDQGHDYNWSGSDAYTIEKKWMPVIFESIYLSEDGIIVQVEGQMAFYLVFTDAIFYYRGGYWIKDCITELERDQQ